MEAQISAIPDNVIAQLRADLATTKGQVAQLQEEKHQMEADFEYKRSKIKDLYFSKETALREQNVKLLEAERQIKNLESTISGMHEEIENVRMIASVSENTKEEAVQNINKHHQEEIESLRCVLQDSMEEQRKELLMQFEQERRRWEQEKTNLEREVNEMKEFQNRLQRQHDGEDKKKQELEIGLEKAQSEVATLKALVLPLETEIVGLKENLRQSKKLLEEERKKFAQDMKNKKQNQPHCAENEDFVVLEPHQDSSSINDMSNYERKTMDQNNQVKELTYSLSAEKSSRSDLELYAEVINKQKVVLQQENDTLKSEMHEVCRLLEKEISDHAALSQTWKAANEEFIDSQKLHLRDMEVVKSVVNREQWKKIKMLQLQDEIDIQAKDLMADHGPMATKDNNHIHCTPTADDVHEEDHLVTQPKTNYSVGIQPSSTLDSIATTLTDFQDTISVSSLPGSVPVVDIVDRQRVLSAPLLNRLGVNQTEEKRETQRAWDETPFDVKEKKKKSTLAYEKLVDASKSDKTLEVLEDKCAHLQKETNDLNKALDHEKKLRNQVEDSVTAASEEAKKQINDLTRKLSDLESRLDEDKSWRRRKETEDDKRLSLLQKDRENIYSELQQVKKENERVQVYYEKHKIDLHKELPPPTTIEGLSVQLRKYREALHAAQVEKSHVESRLESLIVFLQDRLSAEQVAKEQMESTLLSELDQAQKETSSLHEVKAKLDREIATKQDLMIQSERDKLELSTMRAKNNEIVEDLKKKLERETHLREEQAKKLMEAKSQSRSLHEALENSELVQQDFVKLSQSLQVQLESQRRREEDFPSNSCEANSSQPSNQTDSTSTIQDAVLDSN